MSLAHFFKRTAQACPRRALARQFSTTPFAARVYQPVQRPDLYEQYKDGEISLAEFGKSPVYDGDVKAAVQSLKFEEFTPVQQKTLIPFLQEEGLVCRAKTGTGKTFSFVIPLVQHCVDLFKTQGQRRSKVSCLVIAPTRDLAVQIHGDFKRIINHSSALKNQVNMELWTGGSAINRPARPNTMPQIIVGTPGRILGNLENERWAGSFDQLEYRVFDEADRLLDQGFEDQLNAIDDKLKAVRSADAQAPLRNFLFSATIDERVTNFARGQIGADYRYVDCVDESAPESHTLIEQSLVRTGSVHESHVAAIAEIVASVDKKDYKAILFLPTVVGVNFMYDALSAVLPKRSLPVWQLTGKMSQGARRRSTDSFKRADRGVLIATDVAARGMDFKKVTDVIQVSPSQSINDYIHKIGRTGRAGASGRATLYLSHNEVPFARQLVKEKQIAFASETDYEGTPEASQVFAGAGISADAAREYIMSSLGFQTSVCDIYRLDKVAMIEGQISFYRTLVQDPDATIFMRTRFFNQLALPASVVPEYISVDDESGLKRGSKKYGSQMRQQFRKNTRYGDDRNDRFSRNRNDSAGHGSYGNSSHGSSSYGSRGNFNRYERNDRNDRNDRYDRGSRDSADRGNRYGKSDYSRKDRY